MIRSLTNNPRVIDANPDSSRSGLLPSTHRLDLVIPALNEEQRIGRTLAAVWKWADAARVDLNVIVVDNGSSDATTETVDLVSGTRRGVDVVGCRTRGKGAAVRAGVLRSWAPVVGYYDADLSTPPEAIGAALELIENGWDIVIGSRYCHGARLVISQPWFRRSGSWCFRRMARRYVGPVADTQCGFKLFSGEVARSLFQNATVDGFAFDVEIIARARKANYRIAELPVIWSDKGGSTFRAVKDGVSSFRDLAALRRSLSEVP